MSRRSSSCSILFNPLRAKNGSVPIGLSQAVEALVEGVKAGRAEAEPRERLIRLVPDFKLPPEGVSEAVEAEIGSLPN
jgi:hypothetical protein